MTHIIQNISFKNLIRYLFPKIEGNFFDFKIRFMKFG